MQSAEWFNTHTHTYTGYTHTYNHTPKPTHTYTHTHIDTYVHTHTYFSAFNDACRRNNIVNCSILNTILVEFLVFVFVVIVVVADLLLFLFFFFFSSSSFFFHHLLLLLLPLLRLRLLLKWHYSPMRTFASLMDFSHAALFLDITFQFFNFAFINNRLYTVPPSIWSST